MVLGRAPGRGLPRVEPRPQVLAPELSMAQRRRWISEVTRGSRHRPDDHVRDAQENLHVVAGSHNCRSFSRRHSQEVADLFLIAWRQPDERLIFELDIIE